jgi:hypothetical protein
MSSKENFLSVYNFCSLVDLTFSTDVRTANVCPPCSSCALRYTSRPSASLCNLPTWVETFGEMIFHFSISAAGAHSQLLRPRGCLVFIPFDLILYLTNILSAATITAAVGSANRDRIASKPPMRQLVPPLAFFAAALSEAAIFAAAFLAAALSDAALSGTAFIGEPLFLGSFF